MGGKSTLFSEANKSGGEFTAEFKRESSGGITPANIGDYAWLLNGNTVLATKSIGTKNNFDLPFIANNIEWMRLKSTGQFGLGTVSPSARFHVVGEGSTNGTDTAVFHNSTGSSNSLIIRDDGMSSFGTTPTANVRLATQAPIGGFSFQAGNSANTAFSYITDTGDMVVGANSLLTGARIYAYNQDAAQFYSFIGQNTGSGLAGIKLLTQANNFTAFYNVGQGFVGIHTDYRESTVFTTGSQSITSHGIAFQVPNDPTIVDGAFRIVGDDNISSIGFVGTMFYVNYQQVAVGTPTPVANTRFTVKGAGSTSSTYTAQFHNSSGSNNALIIQDDGWVGINTAAPFYSVDKFNILGATGIRGVAGVAESVFYVEGTNLLYGADIDLVNLGNGSDASFLKLRGTGSAGWGIKGLDSTIMNIDSFTSYAVYGEVRGATFDNIGVYGKAISTTGNAIIESIGVFGQSVAVAGTTDLYHYGVYGQCGNGTTGSFHYGVRGTVLLATGSGTTGYGGYFESTGATNNYGIVVPSGGGDSGFGTSAPTASVHIDGTFRYVDTFQSAGKVLASDAFGNATWQAINTLPGGQTENFNWKFDVNTIASDPGSGYFKGNSNVPANITKLYFDDLTNDGFDISNVFSIIKGQWLIYFQDTDDATKFVSFSLLADNLVDNTGWWTMPVTFLQVGAGGLPSNNQKCTFLFVNKNTTPSSQGNTGALTYGGMTAASGTTVNIGALTGWVVDNETDPSNPVQTRIDYPGALGVTVPTIGSGQLSYLLMLPDGAGSATLVWQNTFPTSAQRKTHIYVSKASHPNLVSLGVVGNETDYITSPIGLTRDFFQAVNYVNRGINATAATPGLTFATSAGTIIGNGINFYLSRTNPNEISRAASNPTSFFYRTQTGGATGTVTLIDPTNYDVAGVITPIPGGPNVTTIQYIYAVPFNGVIGFVTLYGQVLYGSIVAGIAAVGKENPVVFPNLIRDAILVGILVVRKGATNLTLAGDAQFFKADYFGQAAGGSGGTSVTTLQQAYDNSGAVDPQILTSTANDGVKFRRGSAANTDSVLVVQNGAGTGVWTVNGNGAVSRRVVTTTQSATPAINTDVTDTSIITGLAQAITSFTTNLTGTATSEQKLWISITDNGTARGITWGASFESSTVALPVTTVISTRLDVGFTWNATTSKWRCVAVC